MKTVILPEKIWRDDIARTAEDDNAQHISYTEMPRQ